MAGTLNFNANENIATTDAPIVYSMPSDLGQDHIVITMAITTKARTSTPGFGQIFPQQQNQYNNY